MWASESSREHRHRPGVQGRRPKVSGCVFFDPVRRLGALAASPPRSSAEPGSAGAQPVEGLVDEAIARAADKRSGSCGSPFCGGGSPRGLRRSRAWLLQFDARGPGRGTATGGVGRQSGTPNSCASASPMRSIRPRRRRAAAASELSSARAAISRRSSQRSLSSSRVLVRRRRRRVAGRVASTRCRSTMSVQSEHCRARSAFRQRCHRVGEQLDELAVRAPAARSRALIAVTATGLASSAGWKLGRAFVGGGHRCRLRRRRRRRRPMSRRATWLPTRSRGAPRATASSENTVTWCRLGARCSSLNH